LNILFLTQLYPYPLADGASLRTFYVLKYLASRGYQVTLVSFIRSPQEREYDVHLAPYCQAIYTVLLPRSRLNDLRFLLASLPGRKPFLVARDYQPAMQQLVDKLLQKQGFDLVYVDHLQMAQYVDRVSGMHLLLDEHNVEFNILRGIWYTEPWGLTKLLAGLDARKLHRWELATVRRFDTLLTVTERDRQILLGELPGLQRIFAIPTSIDLFQIPPVELNPDSHNIVFTGSMYWPPNVKAVLHFYRDIFPRVRAQMPEARFVIVGKKPVRQVMALAERDPVVTVTGYVEDIRPYWADSAVTVVPLKVGSGIRVKILTAMAAGVPVVSTTVGYQGIDLTPGEHILVADDDAAFADAVVRLLRDVGLRRRLAAVGRRLVETMYSWDVTYRKLDAVFEGIEGNKVCRP